MSSTIHTRHFIRHLGGSLLSAMLFVALPACSSEQDSGVTWHAGMKLGDAQPSSLSGWREALSDPWRLHGDPVTMEARGKGGHNTVNSCESLFKARAAGIRPGGSDGAIFDGWAIKCAAVQAMLDATKAKDDFLGGFALGADQVKALPVGVAPAVSNDEEQRIAALEKKGERLGAALASPTLKSIGGADSQRVLVEDKTTGNRVLFSVFAKGDFDHDGVEDLLLGANGSSTQSSYHASKLYVVSRLSKGGPLVLRKVLI